MALNRRALSFRERYWPGVHGYEWSAARIAGMVPVLLVTLIIAVAYFVAVPYALLVFSDPGRVPRDWKQPPPPFPIISSSVVTTDSNPAYNIDDIDGDDDDFEDLAVQRHPLVNRRPDQAQDVDDPEPESAQAFKHWHLMEERSYDGGYRYCHKCAQLKPDRSHHCSMCSRCVLRMDHHCVFIGTCVGFYNHKMFLSFVAYAFLGCTFVCLVGCPQFLHAIGESVQLSGRFIRPAVPVPGARRGGSEMSWVNPALWDTALIVGYIITSAFAVALSIFVLFHGYLVARGRTTIEMYVDPVRSAQILRYNLGVRENLRLALGNYKSHWPLPTRYGIEGDGLSYNTSGPPPVEDVNV